MLADSFCVPMICCSPQVVWGLARVGYSPSTEWTDWIVLQLQQKVAERQNTYWDGSWEAMNSGSEDEDFQIGPSDQNWLDQRPRNLDVTPGSASGTSLVACDSSDLRPLNARQLVYLLQGLSQLDPTSETVIQWMEELVNNVLAEAAFRGDLGPRELAYTLWAAGHLARPTRQHLRVREPSQSRYEACSSANISDNDNWVKRRVASSSEEKQVDDSRLRYAVQNHSHRDGHSHTDRASQPILLLGHRSAKALLNACHKRFIDFTPGQLSMAAYGALLLRLQPDVQWVDALLDASLTLGLSRFSNRDLSLLVNAGGRLKARNAFSETQSHSWVHNVMDELRLRGEHLSPDHVLAALVGLAAFGELRQNDKAQDAIDRSWLPSFIIVVQPSLAAMHPWQLELSYKSATSLQPEMSVVWGANFSSLFQNSSLRKEMGMTLEPGQH